MLKRIIFYFLSFVKKKMARPTGFEPVTLGLEDRCSIQLSYGRIMFHYCILFFIVCQEFFFSLICLKKMGLGVPKMNRDIPRNKTPFHCFGAHLNIAAIARRKSLLSDAWSKILFV